VSYQRRFCGTVRRGTPVRPWAETLEPRRLLSVYTPSTVASFNGTDGSDPGHLLMDGIGNLYGTTASGGFPDNNGTVFEVAHDSSSVTDLASLNGTFGNDPQGLVRDSSGNFFGSTAGTDISLDGVFELPAGSSTINPLVTSAGSGPANLVLDSGDDLFGTTSSGTIFEIANGSDTLSTLATFDGVDGAVPTSLLMDGGGNLFGTATGGGDANGDGVVFEVALASGTITDIAAFTDADGSAPSSLTMDGSGDLYGTCSSGGAQGDGVAFMIASGSGTITDLASFDATDGQPSNLRRDGSGNLFGTTAGDSLGFGSVFEIVNGSGTVSILTSFDSASATPTSLVMDGAGNLFGATNGGGDANGDGTVFELSQGATPTPTTTPGSIDPTFNGGNPVGLGFAAQASVTLADGSVLLAGLEPGTSAGSTQAVLEQLDAAGSIDASFGAAGTVTDAVTSDEAFYGVTTESDGTIVAAGTSDGDLLLAGYNPDGSVDASFGTGGRVIVPVAGATDATAFGISTDTSGDLVVVGSAGGQFLADRFTATGTQDATFNGGAPLLFGTASNGDVLGKAAVQSNGDIVAAGASDGSVVVVRLISAGALDPAFGTGGIVTLSQLAAPDLLPGQPDHTEGLTIDSEGRILVANTTPGGDFATARLTGAGVLDGTFGIGGVVTTGFGGGTADADFVAVQPDGSQVLVAGTYTLNGVVQQAIAAYTPQGMLDTTFGTNGTELPSTGLSAAPALVKRSGQIAPQALGLAGLYFEGIFGNLENGKLLLGVGQQSSSTTAAAAIQRFIAPAPTATPLPVGTLGASVSASLPAGTIVTGAKTNASALLTVSNPTSHTV
jgi:uncharacterized delta-60 repeat protein